MTVAIILAGGLGTRLREKVPNLPKPMAPINNKPFLEHLMYYWIGQGVKHFHLSTGYMFDKIQAHFGNSFYNTPITYSIEDQLLGTGGALRKVLGDVNIKDNFLLLNGDTFFPVSLNRLQNFHKKYNSCMTISLFKFHEPNRFGEIIVNKQENIKSIKTKSKSLNGFANGGVYILNSTCIKDILFNFPITKFSLEDDTIPHMINMGKEIKTIFFDTPFLDIGLPLDYEKASIFLKNIERQ